MQHKTFCVVFNKNTNQQTKVESITADIIELSKQNDRRAQLQLYKQYCDGMYRIARRYIDRSAEAEDVVQEAFIKAFSKLEQYKGEVTFGAWLKRIVINKSIDHLKLNKQRLIGLEDTHLKVVDDALNEPWLVDDEISVDEIKAAIGRLTDKYKYVLKLFLIEGYDHQEISEILGISQVASRTQLSRGKVKLQEQLKHKYYGEGY